MEPLSLPVAFALHQTALARLRRSPGTHKAYRIYVGGFLRFIEERGLDPRLEALNRDEVERYQEWIRARSVGLRDGAVAEQFAIRLLRAFSRWLWRRGFLEHDALARVELPHVPKHHRIPYTEQEMRALVEAARGGPRPAFARALLLLMMDTGCRIGEIAAADVADVDLASGAITLRHTKGNRPRRVVFGVDHLPNGSPCPDGGPCVVAMRAWLGERAAAAGEHALFTSLAGARLSPSQLRRLWARLGKVAGVPNCIPHRGRHTHASELLAELPGAETQLRNRLGHLSTAVLADYVTVTERAAREIACVASLSTKWSL